MLLLGALGTIGFETYKIFKQQGAEVVLLDYDKSKIKETQLHIPDLCLFADVTNRKSVENAYKKICKDFGGIDILVSNAGSVSSGPIAEYQM